MSVADLRGHEEHTPLAQNFFIFMQFSGKIGQIIGWCPPPLGLVPPPLGNPGSATACMVLISNIFKLATSTASWKSYYGTLSFSDAEKFSYV